MDADTPPPPATRTVTYTAADLAAMPPTQLVLLLQAPKITATLVVQRADGTIKYDDPATAGQYGEQYLPATPPPAKDATP